MRCIELQGLLEISKLCQGGISHESSQDKLSMLVRVDRDSFNQDPCGAPMCLHTIGTLVSFQESGRAVLAPQQDQRETAEGC